MQKSFQSDGMEQLIVHFLGLRIMKSDNNEGVLISNIDKTESKLLKNDVVIEINREKILNICDESNVDDAYNTISNWKEDYSSLGSFLDKC